MNPPSQPAFVMLKWAMTRRSQMSEVLEDNQWLHGLIRKWHELCVLLNGFDHHKYLKLCWQYMQWLENQQRLDIQAIEIEESDLKREDTDQHSNERDDLKCKQIMQITNEDELIKHLLSVKKIKHSHQGLTFAQTVELSKGLSLLCDDELQGLAPLTKIDELSDTLCVLMYNYMVDCVRMKFLDQLEEDTDEDAPHSVNEMKTQHDDDEEWKHCTGFDGRYGGKMPTDLFLLCKKHVSDDIESHFKYSKNESHCRGELQENLITLSKKIIQQCRSAPFSEIMALINFYLIITCVQSFHFDQIVDVGYICKSWRDLLHLSCSQTTKCELKWEKQSGQYSATIFGFLVCINEQSEMIIPHFNVVQSGSAMRGFTYLNPLYHPSAAEYMTTFKSSKLTHVPLMNVQIVGKVDSHTDQISEGTFNLWKNYDMPERLRLDSAWRHLTDTSDAKIGRFMLELQVSLRSELKRSVTENKDSVSKLNRDKEEWEMYGLFQDCLRYAWDYNRKHIVQVFDHWNRTPEGGIKWNITFNVGSCTKLMNKKRLNTSIIWRTAVKAFLNDSIAEHGPKETTNNSNNAMP
eukprot:57895_1